jgi:hypothetical protein
MGIEKSKCKDADIILLLDGDDWFFSVDVLSHLNSVYQDKNLLLTYGDYIHSDNGQRGLNKEITGDIKDYRKNMMGWCTSHLRTFQYKLWRHIEDEDLRDKNNKYYAMSWDLAIILPMVEMAGKDRIKFIQKILYTYNTENPISDHKKNLRLQLEQAKEIRLKPSYERIEL